MAEGDASRRRLPLRNVGPGVAGLFSLALFASLPLIPVLGIFLGLLAPLPLVHLVATGKSSLLGWGWVAAILAGGALATQQTLLVATCFGYLLVAALPALGIELWTRRSWSTARLLALVSLAALVMSCGFLSAVFYPQAPATALAAILNASGRDASTLVGALMGGGTSVQEMIAAAMRMTATLAPALAALFVQSSVLWLRPRLPLLGLDRGNEPFSALGAEEWLPVGFALGGLGWVFARGVPQWLAINLFVTVLSLYFFAGLAVVHYYLGPKLAANRWVRVLVVVLLLQPPVPPLLAVAGLVDSFFRLRRGGQSSGGSEP
jgi:uncharacterized protein YybS (DUF2232 family)